MREMREKVVPVAFSPACAREGVVARNFCDADYWTGVAVFPKGGSPHVVRSCLSKREALARAMAEGRRVWRKDNERWDLDTLARCEVVA